MTTDIHSTTLPPRSFLIGRCFRGIDEVFKVFLSPTLYALSRTQWQCNVFHLLGGPELLSGNHSPCQEFDSTKRPDRTLPSTWQHLVTTGVHHHHNKSPPCYGPNPDWAIFHTTQLISFGRFNLEQSLDTATWHPSMVTVIWCVVICTHIFVDFTDTYLASAWIFFPTLCHWTENTELCYFTQFGWMVKIVQHCMCTPTGPPLSILPHLTWCCFFPHLLDSPADCDWW